MTLEEILSKQAKGEKLTEAEEKFLKTSSNEPEPKKEEGKVEEPKIDLSDEIVKLRAEIDKLKAENQLKEKELENTKSQTKIAQDLLKEKESKLKETIDTLGKDKAEQEILKTKLELEEQKKKDLENLKSTFESQVNEVKQELEATKRVNKIAQLKLDIEKEIREKPYLQGYYDKLKLVLNNEDTEKALTEYQVYKDTLSKIIDEEEEKKRYESANKKKSTSIFDNTGLKLDKETKSKEELDLEERQKEAQVIANWAKANGY